MSVGLPFSVFSGVDAAASTATKEVVVAVAVVAVAWNVAVASSVTAGYWGH